MITQHDRSLSPAASQNLRQLKLNNKRLAQNLILKLKKISVQHEKALAMEEMDRGWQRKSKETLQRI